ncbi:MAG: DNA polymerase I [Clostridia bacterium]|nr:DNA polymerase I [Clostridia bacterium]
MKLLAIDGNSVINRAFYGIRLLSTKDGRFTNAIFGFTNILLHLIEEQKPDAIVVAWDLKKPTFRHKMYDAYKAGRHAMPDELREQIPLMKEIITLLGFGSIECEGYEADDILGTLARICEESGNSCIIATGDRDSLQLVSDSTNVLLSATKAGRPEITRYDTEAIKEKYGVTPAGMIELKALMGDSSDNIPGVAGIGEKTASALIGAYENIDYIYEHLDELEIKDSVREKLRAGRDSAYLSRTLGTICRTSPIDNDINAYENKPPRVKELSALLSDLELFKIIDRLNLSAATVDSVCPEGGCVNTVDFSDFTIGKFLDIVEIEDKLYLSSGDLCTVADITECRAILENENIAKRVFDCKKLYKNCRKEGISPQNICFDAMLAGYLLSPSASSYDIERLAQEYSAPYPKAEDENISLSALHSSVCNVLGEKLKENGQGSLLYDIELPLARVLADMEYEGVLIDAVGIERYGEELALRIEQIENDIYSLVGYKFNLNSPKQLGVALFEDLGLPAKKKTKSGYSTNAEVLESLRYAHPAVSLLLEYRQLAKLKSTYCDGLLKTLESDGRIHSTFNQTETRTGRISSLEPNLQNIPVRTEEGRKLRRFFRAADGYVLCDADYSQIELRVLAHMANDINMINAFNSGVDIHTSTASEVFSMPIDMVTPVMRSRAKAVNFGIVYGIGAFSLAKDIGVTRAEADSYIKNYLKTYPQIDEYMHKTIENAKKDGFVVTEFGRRRYIPELASSNGMMRAFGERVARNMPIQGTAADIIKIAMIRVANRLKAEGLDARLILQVHDELIVEAKSDIGDKVCSIIKQEMEGSAKMAVALSVDAACGETWYEAKQ